MSKVTVLCAALLVLCSLSGCRIEIEVPKGGTVTTDSGTFSCYSGQTCVIDISDTRFDETFKATPPSGYKFAGWKKKEKSFCGGNNKPCALSTTQFGPHPALMSLLNSNEVFYLEPVFTKVTTGNNRLRIYKPGDVIEFRGTISVEPRYGSKVTAPVTVRWEFFSSSYTYASEKILTVKQVAMVQGERLTSTTHFFQNAEGAIFNLVDDDDNFLYDSGIGSYGVLNSPSPMVASTSNVYQTQVLDGNNTSSIISMASKTILVSPKETVSVPLGKFSAFLVSTESRSEYLTYTEDNSPGEYEESSSIEWIAPGIGVVKVNLILREYSSYGSLQRTGKLLLEATSKNF